MVAPGPVQVARLRKKLKMMGHVNPESLNDLDELERRDLNTALVTLCIGAGMGTATIIERV